MHSPNSKVSIKVDNKTLSAIQNKTSSSDQNVGWLVEGNTNPVGWYTENTHSVGWYTESTK